jgi:transposase
MPREPQKNGDQALGHSRGGLTTKIHALVEGLGCLARWTLSGGQLHDVTQAEAILDGIVTQAVVADKAYDADSLIESITQCGACAVIPPRGNRREPWAFDTHQYKHRNLIERFFCRLKQFHRIATRYDKLASRFSGFIAIADGFHLVDLNVNRP